MKRVLVSLLCFGGLAVAQNTSTAAKQSTETQQKTTTQNANGSQTVNNDTVYGRVESFDPGKSIKVTVPGKIINTKSFSLDSKDARYSVAKSVKVGDWVMVNEKDGPNGHKTVTIRESTKNKPPNS